VQLLRHGETCAGERFCGSTDVALSSLGWAQMRTAVQTDRFEQIVSSPLLRCLAFARELGERTGAPCRVDDDWRELYFGRWEGRTARELMQTDREALTSFWADPLRHAPPQGESLVELEARVMRAWSRVRAEACSGATLVVTHGGPLRVLRARVAGLPVSAALACDVPHATLLEIPYAWSADAPSTALGRQDGSCVPS
jgi:alpha-ribazole phosphatase